LGVQIQNVTMALAEAEGLKVNDGVYIASTIDLGAAKEAGIKKGDIITKIAERSVKNVTEMQEQLSKFRPGDEILVTVDRDGQTMNIPLTLRNQFGEEELTPKKELELHEKLNALMEDIDDETKALLKINSGVRIAEIGTGKLRSAGISKDFIITKVDQITIKDKKHLMEVLESKSGGVLIEGVYHNGKKAYYGFGL
jgi:serine protease Do